MPKAEPQVAESVEEESSQCVTSACTELEEAVKDRRENGGTREVVRAKAFTLIEQLFADIEA